MATILDTSLIQSFDVIFPVLLVWVIGYATLEKTEVLGKSHGVNGFVAAILGLTVLLSNSVINLINEIAPWYALAIVFFILFFLLFRIFGAEDDNFKEAIKRKEVYWIVIGIGLVIFAGGVANTFGQDFTNEAFNDGSVPTPTPDGLGTTTNFEQNTVDILFNPKVLGVMVIFGMLIAAIALLTGNVEK